jgi:hypothetical protein
MAVTLITGTQATDTINAAQMPPDMDDQIHYLEPDVSPFTILTQKLRKRKAINPKVEWLQQQRLPRFTTLSASAAATASGNSTTFGVSADIFRVGDVVRIPSTGEGIEITGTAAGLATGVRGLGVAITAGLSAANGAEVFIVGNVNSEGASLREIKTPKVDNALNYCEIVRTPTGLTGTDAATQQFGGVSRRTLQGDANVEHMRTWEGISLVGIKRVDTSTTGAPKRFAGGATEFVTTNITNVGGTLSEATFQTFLQTGFRYGSSNKLLLVSPLVLGVIEGFARSNVKGSSFSDRGNVYGIKMSRYESGQGSVDIVTEKWLLDSGTYKGWGFLFDMDNVAFASLRDSRLYEDRQAPDADSIKDEYLGEGCFVFINEQNHAIMKGITG